MSGGGSPHLHSKFVRGCYRCEISRDEAWHALTAEVEESRAQLAAIEAELDRRPEAVPSEVIRAILDGPAGG